MNTALGSPPVTRTVSASPSQCAAMVRAVASASFKESKSPSDSSSQRISQRGGSAAASRRLSRVNVQLEWEDGYMDPILRYPPHRAMRVIPHSAWGDSRIFQGSAKSVTAH